jgi:CHAT domain-containing protein
MERLYRGLRAGLSPAAALGAAMNEARAQYDHPYFWAPFVVSGSGLDATASPLPASPELAASPA